MSITQLLRSWGAGTGSALRIQPCHPIPVLGPEVSHSLAEKQVAAVWQAHHSHSQVTLAGLFLKRSNSCGKSQGWGGGKASMEPDRVRASAW